MSPGACCRSQGTGGQYCWVSLFLNLVFMMCLCFSLGLHLRLLSIPEPLKCKGSSEAVQQDGDSAAAVNLGLWNSSLEGEDQAQLMLFYILYS